MPPPPTRNKGPGRVRRFFPHLLIAGYLFTAAVDCLPVPGSLFDGLRNVIHPVLVRIGLWQGEWSLFAPDAAKLNHRVSAHMVYEDGLIQEWAAPDVAAWSPARKFFGFRHMEYWDSIQMDDNEDAWQDLARYLIRTQTIRSKPVTRIILVRNWRRNPPPNSPPPGPDEPRYPRYSRFYELKVNPTGDPAP